MPKLRVTRLLQNPLGHVAPEGQRGDLVRVTDGRATVYLVPYEFEMATESRLRDMLAAKLVPEPPGASRHAPPASDTLDVRSTARAGEQFPLAGLSSRPRQTMCPGSGSQPRPPKDPG